jgi:hypothetical protein
MCNKISKWLSVNLYFSLQVIQLKFVSQCCSIEISLKSRFLKSEMSLVMDKIFSIISLMEFHLGAKLDRFL